MKRLTLLTILLVVVSLTAGFAEETKPTITLTGSGTLQWGIDLDTGATGFLNSAASTAVLNFPAGAATKGGKDGWYGEITLAAPVFTWSLDQASALTLTLTGAAVTAKIVGMGGMAVIGVYGAPDTGSNTDFVAAIESDEIAVDDDVFLEDEVTGDVDTSYGTYGTYLSYTVSEAITVGLEAVSEGDWTTNTAQAYAFALDVLAKFTPITVTAGANYGFNYASNPIGFGVKVAADTDMVDGWVGFDGQLAGAAFAWEVGAGVTATLMETVTAALSVVYGDAFNDLDLQFVLTEPAAAGLVDNLDLTLTVMVLDLADVLPMEYKVIVDGGYKMGIVYPNFTVTYYDDTNDADFTVDGQALTAVVGADVAIITNTTFKLYWTSGNLLATPADKGTLVAGVTVTY